MGKVWTILLSIFMIAIQSVASATIESATPRSTFQNFLKERNSFIDEEVSRGIGFNLQLNPKETLFNDHVMKLKAQEYTNGLQDPTSFSPALHFFEVLAKINQSELFKIIRKMPKGGVLHAHDTALCNLDFFVKLTYWDNLWQVTDSVSKQLQFKFSRTKPADGWVLVKDERDRMGVQIYDSHLRGMISMYNTNPLLKDRDVDSIWRRFMEIFAITDGVLFYKDAWRAYYLQALLEFEEDEVHYLELRSTLPQLYDLDGNLYNEVDVAQIYYDATIEFQKTHPKFMEAKIIYAPIRIVDDERFDHYIEVCKKLNAKFPGFVIGFDLVAQEDNSRPLIDFAERILTLPTGFKLFFHAGETNWNGLTDDNLVDAILLGATRIGHGYALTKRPKALEQVKLRDIALEVNPISNQVLRLVSDTRNHPAATFFSDNYPVVISSDDPSFWEAKPLSHDFYYAFLGIASSRQDLRVLKQLAINSIKYSGASEVEKRRNMAKWTVTWDAFVNQQVNQLGV